MSREIQIVRTESPSREDEWLHHEKSEESFAHNFANTHGQRQGFTYFFVKDPAGRTIGGARIVMSFDYLFLDTMWIDESSRLQGHGLRLYDAIEQAARDEKKRRILLHTFGIQGALKFWTRFGFRVTHTIQFLEPSPEAPQGFAAYYLEKSLS